MTRRMHFRIWISFMVVLVISVIVSGMVVNLVFSKPSFAENAHVVADYFVADLAKMEPPARQERLDAFAKAFGLDMGLYDSQRALIAGAGTPPPLPKDLGDHKPLSHDGHTALFNTTTGYHVTINHRPQFSHASRIVFWLSSFVGLLFLGSYFISRRLTRRLERLQRAVAEWDFAQPVEPVPIEGKDEVARLAESFNSAARRITALLGQQRNLLASASHELRTPLARIRLASQMMAESQAPQKREETLAAIHDDINELDGLVDDILLAARLDANPLEHGELELVDLGQLAAEAAGAFGYPAEGSAQVRGHRKMLRRLIGNLVENAAKHAPGAPVRVEVSQREGSAFIRVSDGGPGLSAEERERVFDPFFRGGASSGAEGYGLGLSIVKKIAQRHGGNARCLRQEGGGLLFEVELPAA